MPKHLTDIQNKFDEILIQFQKFNTDEMQEDSIEGKSAFIFLNNYSFFVESLNKSILAGEYYYQNCQTILKLVEKAIMKIIALLDVINKKDSSIDLNLIFLDKIRVNLPKLIEKYKQLNWKVLKPIIEKKEALFVFNNLTYEYVESTLEKYYKKIKNISRNNTTNQNFFGSERDVSLFKINIMVALLDNKFNSSNDYLKSLFTIKTTLEKIEKIWGFSTIVLDILLDKTNYLIKKAFIRNEIKVMHTQTREYVLSDFKITYFTQFDKLTKERYNSNETYNFGSKEYEIINANCTKTSDFLYLSKCYRINHQNQFDDPIEKTNKLLELFEEKKSGKKNENLNSFNKISNCSTELMLHKNKLRILCEQFKKNSNKDTFEHIENQLNVTQIIEENGRKDYYHYYLCFNALIPYLERKTEKKKVINQDTHNLLITIVEFLESIRINYMDNFSWMEDVLPIYLPYNECCINDYALYPGSLFLDSGYMLSVNRQEAEKEKNNLLNRFNLIEIIVQGNKQIQDSINKTNEFISESKTLFADQKESFEEHKKSSYQTLGIFSALIAFVVTSATAATKFENIYTLIIFMLGFVLALLYFICIPAFLPVRFSNS